MNKINEIKNALDTLGLPVLISLKDIKERYYTLSKEKHPDLGGEEELFQKIVESYKVLKDYVENYRFTFSDEEILKQFPSENHARKFRF